MEIRSRPSMWLLYVWRKSKRRGRVKVGGRVRGIGGGEKNGEGRTGERAWGGCGGHGDGRVREKEWRG